MQAKCFPEALSLRVTALHILRVPTCLFYPLLQSVAVLEMIEREGEFKQNLESLGTGLLHLELGRDVLLPHLVEAQVLVFAHHEM